MRDVDNGEAMHVWGQEAHGVSVVFAQFCCEPKTSLKSILKSGRGQYLISYLDWIKFVIDSHSSVTNSLL